MSEMKINVLAWVTDGGSSGVKLKNIISTWNHIQNEMKTVLVAKTFLFHFRRGSVLK